MVYASKIVLKSRSILFWDFSLEALGYISILFWDFFCLKDLSFRSGLFWDLFSLSFKF